MKDGGSWGLVVVVVTLRRLFKLLEGVVKDGGSGDWVLVILMVVVVVPGC